MLNLIIGGKQRDMVARQKLVDNTVDQRRHEDIYCRGGFMRRRHSVEDWQGYEVSDVQTTGADVGGFSFSGE